MSDESRTDQRQNFEGVGSQGPGALKMGSGWIQWSMSMSTTRYLMEMERGEKRQLANLILAALLAVSTAASRGAAMTPLSLR